MAISTKSKQAQQALWMAVYGATYVRAAGGKSLGRLDVAKLCHEEARQAADVAIEALTSAEEE